MEELLPHSLREILDNRAKNCTNHLTVKLQCVNVNISSPHFRDLILVKFYTTLG